MGAVTAGAVVYAKDVDKLRAFYVAVAGLTCVHAEDDHVVLERAGFQLVLLRIPAQRAALIHVADPPVRRSDTAIKLVFVIDDLGVARAAAALHGGELNRAAKEWAFQTWRVCDGHDPEGNVVQFRCASA